MLEYLMDNKKALLIGSALGAVAAYVYLRRDKASPATAAKIKPGVEIHSVEAVSPPAIFYPQPGSSDGPVIWIEDPAARK